MVTRDSKGNNMAFLLDGKNDRAQLMALGATIDVDPNGDVSIVNAAGTSILIQGGDISLNGNVHLQGMQPGMTIMQGPPSGSPGGPASVPLFAVMGVGK